MATKQLRFAFSMLGLVALSIAGYGAIQFMMQSSGPAPFAPVDTENVTSSPLPDLDFPDPFDPRTSDREIAVVSDAIAAIRASDAERFEQARDRLQPDTISRLAVDWSAAVYGPEVIDARQLSMAAQRFSNWPKANIIARNLELAQLTGTGGLLRRVVTPLPENLLTMTGKLAKADRLLANGDREAMRAIIAPIWRNDALWRSLEDSFLQRYGDVLEQADHRARYFNMMVRERIQSGERVVELAGMEALHEPWSAVIRNQDDAGSLISKVPDSALNTIHGLFMRVEYARKIGMIDEAAQLLAQLPDDPREQINPDAWWIESRIVSRNLAESGDGAGALALAQRHRGGTDTTRYDAAFHAGWYALRFANQPESALANFDTMRMLARRNESRAKADYWTGRAYAALDKMDAAQSAWRNAAALSKTYYGQLALHALGQAVAFLEINHDVSDLAMALRIEGVAAGLLLASANDLRGSLALLSGMGETINDPAVVAALVDHLHKRREHFIALRVAKGAESNDLDIGLATHPVGVLEKPSTSTSAQLALAYAVARQESEFRTDAVSGAGALGILQVLPETARGVATRLGLPFSVERLTQDQAYNAAIGTRYLAEQLDRFGHSYVLTLIAYNAGPGRARGWIERYGNPRGLGLIEAIDWVETIPFPETRSYVQKVMANLQIYRAQLGADPDLTRDLTAGQ